MSFVLIAAIGNKAVLCGACKQPVSQTENYQAQYVDLPVLGNPSHRELVSEEVTLVCGACGWRERTRDWRKYVVPVQAP